MALVPFALPATLEPDLAAVHAYWRGLIRGEASDMPYWDDVKLSDLPALADRLTLATAFAKPERFRFEIVGKEISARYGKDFAGRFADEIDINAPLDFFRSQASVTVESGAPTYFRASDYARLLLPLWGDGHISMVLAAVVRL
ncbi:MAG: hypothetical protein Q7V31_06790 [Parvibaculum sp.]|uniref:hypothetical protein n=1 Tax=Parvibaculum sp. TaxID=2024848 RepID=UPI0027181F36|nr:hypothetical protein [Parvibaculum sp.]MDO8838621.1 hypothetical protein [Parvibaculum sp.]